MKTLKAFAIVVSTTLCSAAFSQVAVTDYDLSRCVAPCEACSIMNEIQDLAILKAIRQSQESLPEFCEALGKRTRAQTDFLVTILEDDGDSYFPVGILVDRVGEASISGRKVANDLLCSPGEPITCPISAVVDWRYTDTFEMVGGALYRELYKRRPKRIQFTIRDKQPFLICREEEIDPDLLQLFRDIANGHLARLVKLLEEYSSKKGLMADMPALRPFDGRGVIVSTFTIQEYGVMYGDRHLIDLLWERGALCEEHGEYPLVARSARTGNLQTMTRLLELRFDANCMDKVGYRPLHIAAIRDEVEIATCLLRHGADCNLRDRREATPLFHVVSAEFADLLIKAGADVNAVNDNGETCLVPHLRKRRTDIVRLLVDAGAVRDRDSEKPTGEGDPADAEEAVIEYLEATGNLEGLESLRMALSTDFGCVLPVASIPKD